MRKLPPYARELMAARRRGVQVNLHLMAGDHAWRRAKGRSPPHVLCLPSGDSFDAFNWSCVSGLDVTLAVWNRPLEFVDGFARHLIHAGARRVAALGAHVVEDGAVRAVETTIYMPTRQRGAA
jgi:hypothetical protein